MARLSGKAGKVKVCADGGGAPLEVLGVTAWSIDPKGDVTETTGMDSSGAKEYLAALTEWSGSCEGHFDTAEPDILATAGPTPPLVSVGSRLEFEFYILGTDAAARYKGDAIVTGFNVKVAVNGAVDWSCTYQGSQALLYPTIT